MATLNFGTIKILRDDSAGTLKTAFSKTFYGAESSLGDGDPDGYPNIGLTNLGFNINDYEIKMPQDLNANITIATNTTTLTADDDVFSAGDVGKLIWNASDLTNLKLIGKIASYTAADEVELVENYGGASITDAGVAAYISDVSDVDHNQSLNFKGNFYILVGVEDNGSGKPALPSVSGMQNFATNLINGVQQGLNTNYVALSRISATNNKVSPSASATQIPATIARINGYVVSSQANKYFSFNGDIPYWVAYEVNPFGTANKNLDKNTTYSLEIQETLPTWDNGSGAPKGIDVYVDFISATYGII